MRSAIAITAAVSTLIYSAAATDCNPSYDVPTSTECYTNCNIKNGQKWVPGWTMDHTSPLFLDSLTLMCDRTGANYGSFMAAAGMCMAGCTGDDPELFNQEWSDACAWWTEHKNDKCDAGTITTTTTTTKAATTTTTTTKTTTTTTKATTTSTKTTTTTTKTTTKATATATSAATNCNPSYNVPGSTECYTNCNIQAGQKWVSGWTMDHTSPLFLDSLALMCDRTGANYGGFMAAAGMCMAGCTGDDPELFNQEWASACAWWTEHKTDTCDAGTATNTATEGVKTVTKTVTVSACPTTSPSSCQTGFSGKKNGMGPEGACCTHSNDCQESCIKGKCNAPIASTCYTWSIGGRRGDGFNGACCSHSDDCWESCVNGKCNGPSLAECTMGFLGKRKGNGLKGSCCTSNRDCKNSCIKGKCN